MDGIVRLRRSYVHWTPSLENEVARRSALNESDDVIGLALGFSRGAVKIKRVRLGLRKPMGRKRKPDLPPRAPKELIIFKQAGLGSPGSAWSEFISMPSLARLMAGR